jgi:hypothetical protein
MSVKWYKERLETKALKVVPLNLILTPLIVAHWYCGDGTSDGKQIAFCTDGFDISDIKILIDKMKIQLGVDTHICRFNKRLYIDARHNEKFIEMVRPHIFKCFQYKLDLAPVKHLINPRRNHWIFVSPEGKRFEINCLGTFAKKHGLSCTHLSKVFNGTRNSHKNWTKG